MAMEDVIVFGDVTVIFFLVCQVICLLSCLVFTLVKLKLNKFIKFILIIMMKVNSICLCLILFSSLMDESWRCKVTATTCAFLITGTFTMTNLISILRYYMAILSSKAKIAQGKVVIPFIIFWSLFCHGFFPCLILIQEYLGFESAISRCEGTLGKSKNSILFILWLIFLIGMTLIGLYCDKSLYDFVKKQHQIPKNEPRLVAWKSTNFTVQEDLQVPIRATAMSTFLIVLSTLFVILALNHNKDWDEFKLDFGYAIALIIIFTASFPILVVIFTIKRHGKVQVQNVQPPKQLHFHDDHIEERPEILMNQLNFHECLELESI